MKQDRRRRCCVFGHTSGEEAALALGGRVAAIFWSKEQIVEVIRGASPGCGGVPSVGSWKFFQGDGTERKANTAPQSGAHILGRGGGCGEVACFSRWHVKGETVWKDTTHERFYLSVVEMMEHVSMLYVNADQKRDSVDFRLHCAVGVCFKLSWLDTRWWFSLVPNSIIDAKCALERKWC